MEGLRADPGRRADGEPRRSSEGGSILLTRYINGEHENVWTELRARGELRDQGEAREEARDVAKETMRRARRNLELLIRRLRHEGWQFGDLADEAGYWQSPPPLEPPPEPSGHAIRSLENVLGGRLPVALEAFYAECGGVNLVGFHPEWPETSRLDPLLILPAIGSFESEVTFQIKRWRSSEPAAGEPFALDLSPSAFEKSNLSGGGPYYVEVPSLVCDPPVLGEPHKLTLVEYLRHCIKHGGFAGLDNKISGWERVPLDRLTRELEPF